MDTRQNKINHRKNKNKVKEIVNKICEACVKRVTLISTATWHEVFPKTDCRSLKALISKHLSSLGYSLKIYIQYFISHFVCCRVFFYYLKLYQKSLFFIFLSFVLLFHLGSRLHIQLTLKFSLRLTLESTPNFVSTFLKLTLCFTQRFSPESNFLYI